MKTFLKFLEAKAQLGDISDHPLRQVVTKSIDPPEDFSIPSVPIFDISRVNFAGEPNALLRQLMSLFQIEADKIQDLSDPRLRATVAFVAHELRNKTRNSQLVNAWISKANGKIANMGEFRRAIKN